MFEQTFKNIDDVLWKEAGCTTELGYIALALAPITRQARVGTHRKDIFAAHDVRLQYFIEFVLAQYVNEGVRELDEEKLPDLLELRYQSVHTVCGAEPSGGLRLTP
jgi:hypothetical protein